MTKYFPEVDAELLITVNRLAKEEIQRCGSLDLPVLLAVGFGDKYPVEQLTSVQVRLNALSKMLGQAAGEKWTMSVAGKEYKLVNEAVFHAAAKTPLPVAKTIGEASFDEKEFLEIALEESEPEGSA